MESVVGEVALASSSSSGWQVWGTQGLLAMIKGSLHSCSPPPGEGQWRLFLEGYQVSGVSQ